MHKERFNSTNLNVGMLYCLVILMYNLHLITYNYLDTDLLIIPQYECTMFYDGKQSNRSAIETIIYMYSLLNCFYILSMEIHSHGGGRAHFTYVIDVKCKKIQYKNSGYTFIVYMIIIYIHEYSELYFYLSTGMPVLIVLCMYMYNYCKHYLYGSDMNQPLYLDKGNTQPKCLSKFCQCPFSVVHNMLVKHSKTLCECR